MYEADTITAAPSTLKRILYWVRVALELAVPLVLLAPPIWALFDPYHVLFTLQFLIIETGVCFGGFVLAVIGAVIIKRIRKPKKQITVNSILRYLNADDGLMRLGIGLMGAAAMTFGTACKLDGTPFLFWTSLPVCLLCIYLAFSSVAKGRTTVNQMLRGRFLLVLAELTSSEIKTVESTEYGSNGTGYHYHYEYYLHFADIGVFSERSVKVSKSEYYDAYSGKRYYLVILNHSIKAAFPQSEHTLDEQLEKMLTVKIVSAEEKQALEKRKSNTEAAVLEAFQTVEPRQTAASVSPVFSTSAETQTLTPDRTACRKTRSFRLSLTSALLITAAVLTLLFLTLTLVFRLDDAYILVPMTLIPLLLGLIPLNSGLKKKIGIPAHPMQSHPVTERSFLLEKTVSPALGAAALLYIFLALGWASGCWADGDADLLAPLFVMISLISGIPSLVFGLIALSRFRKRKRALKSNELVILELPVLRKEEEVSTDPTYTLYFPDIDRGPGTRIPGRKATGLHFFDGSAVSENGRIHLHVDRREYFTTSEGDLYYLLINESPKLLRPELCAYYHRDRAYLDSDMLSRVTDLNQYQIRYNALHPNH